MRTRFLLALIGTLFVAIAIMKHEGRQRLVLAQQESAAAMYSHAQIPDPWIPPEWGKLPICFDGDGAITPCVMFLGVQGQGVSCGTDGFPWEEINQCWCEDVGLQFGVIACPQQPRAGTVWELSTDAASTSVGDTPSK